MSPLIILIYHAQNLTARGIFENYLKNRFNEKQSLQTAVNPKNIQAQII